MPTRALRTFKRFRPVTRTQGSFTIKCQRSSTIRRSKAINVCNMFRFYTVLGTRFTFITIPSIRNCSILLLTNFPFTNFHLRLMGTFTLPVTTRLFVIINKDARRIRFRSFTRRKSIIRYVHQRDSFFLKRSNFRALTFRRRYINDFI